MITAVDREELRVAIYRGFAETGRAPTCQALADILNVVPEEIISGMRDLAAARHLVLDPGDEVVMAHPFSSIPLGFAVMGRRTLWWGGCAWDAFALPHLLHDEPDVLVATRCPGCDRPLAWVVGRHSAPEGREVAHFLTPVSKIWDDVVHACANQRLFCDRDCVLTWLTRTGHSEGYVMDLGTLWRLGSDWYTGRLSRGYTRREPADARTYFRDVGLQGDFWGLSGT